MRFGYTALPKWSPNGVLAQLVERLLCKQDVRGSSPLFSICGFSSVVERNLAKVDVIGSNPIIRSKWPYSEVVYHAYLSSRNPGFEFP